MLRACVDPFHEIEVVVENVGAEVRENSAGQHDAKCAEIEMPVTEARVAPRRQRCAEENRHDAGWKGISSGCAPKEAGIHEWRLRHRAAPRFRIYNLKSPLGWRPVSGNYQRKELRRGVGARMLQQLKVCV